MKRILLLSNFVVAFTEVVYGQNEKCENVSFSEFVIICQTDTSEVHILQSDSCTAYNFWIYAGKKLSKGCFQYDQNSNFHSCISKEDYLLWAYFFVSHNKSDTKLINTSQPYSNKDKNERKYFYHSTFTVDNVNYSANFTYSGNVITYFKLFEDTGEPGLPLKEIGMIIESSNY